MQKLPEPLQAVIDQMARLPGLGPKSAMRCAMTLLQWPMAETRRLGQAIHSLRDSLGLCSRCGALTDHDPCPICRDPGRDSSLLCLVAEWDSLLTLEQGGFYKGHYLILGGLLSPLDNINPEQLDLERLDKRLAEGEVKEVIFALDTRLEAENTASFIKRRISSRHPGISISRLAQGIPLGSEVRAMDKETLRQSMKFRQNL